MATAQEIQAEVEATETLEKCRHGKYLRCSECSVNMIQYGRNEGYEKALEVALKALGDEAGTLFVQGKDSQAKNIRDLLEKVRVVLEKSRPDKE